MVGKDEGAGVVGGRHLVDDEPMGAAGVRRSLGALLLLTATVAAMWLLSSCTAAPLGIGGTITVDGAVRPGVLIEVFPVPPGAATPADVGAPTATTATDASGHFSVRPIQAGHYWVRLGGVLWDTGTNHGGATPADVVVGPSSPVITSDIPASTGGLSGTIRRTGTGAPLPGVTVEALSATGTRDLTVASTTTDGNGQYAFDPAALPIGQYVVRLSRSTYLTHWAPDAGAPSEATVFPVASGTSTTNVNGTVDTPRSVNARITNGHLPIAGAVVTLYREDGRLLTSATTAADGRISFVGLDAARYRFLVAPPAPYRTEAWGTRSDPDVMHSALIDLVPVNANPWDAGDDVVSTCDPVTFAPGSDHSGQDLTGADLRGCDLTGSNFTNATLTGARVEGTAVASATFAGADLRSVRSGGMTGLPLALPPSFQVRQGWLLGPQVDLSDESVGALSVSGAVLTGADLRRTDLRGASMTSCDLSGADATDADLSRTTFMAGCTFNGASFAGATFTGASVLSTNVTGVDLTSAHLTSSSWTGSNLTAASFTGADLTKANFGNVTITGAALGGATMSGLRSGGVVGSPATIPPAWILTNGYFVGPGADLYYANVASTDLRATSLVGTSFKGANVAGANLSGVDATGADFSYASLGHVDARAVNFAEAQFVSTDMWGADITGASFGAAHLAGVRSSELVGAPASLPPGWGLRVGTFMGPGVDLGGRNLAGADLSGLDLSGAKFSGSQYVGAPGANLTAADLHDTNLTGADLEKTTITGATVSGASFAATKLGGVHSGGVLGVPAALPSNWRLRNGYFAGPKADLVASDLSGTELVGIDLGGAALDSAKLDGADLSGANLDSANAIHASFLGTRLTSASIRYAILDDTTLTSALLDSTNLTASSISGSRIGGTNLSGAVLEQVKSGGLTGVPTGLAGGWKATAGYIVGPLANLKGANLAGADLSGASLENADLTSVSSGGVTGTPVAVPVGWRLTQGYLVGPTAYLDAADLHGADLSGISLESAYLGHANLQGTNVNGTRFGTDLAYVRSGGMTGTPALLQPGYRVSRGFLFGNYADLGGADLTGVDASGATLVEANLNGATLTGANFLGASGARASNAVYSAGAPTTCPDGKKAPTQVTNCIGHGFLPIVIGS